MSNPAIETKSIKIVLADDHALVREAFRLLLKRDESIEVIGQAGNGKELLNLLKDVKPDMVLLDIEMPLMNGIEALENITKRFPEVSVIMLTLHNDISVMSDCLAKGAKAFLTKDGNSEILFEAIHAVKKDGHYINKSVSQAILEGYIHERKVNPIFGELALSKREHEVLIELCDGKTNKQIAEKLKITASTVDFHRGRIYKKTKSRNLAGIVKYAMKHGIIRV